MLLLAAYTQTISIRQKTPHTSIPIVTNDQTITKKPTLLKQVSASEGTEVVTATTEANPVPVRADQRVVVVPVLMYHYIQPSLGRDKLTIDLSVSPEHFAEQMKYLVTSGFTTISPQELEEGLLDKKPLPNKPIILSFDDGYRDFYLNAYPILKRDHLKATNFIPTGLVDKLWYLHTSDIKEMAGDDNITFAGHTISHAQLTSLPTERAFAEINTGKKQLEAILGRGVDFFAYPYGAFDNRVITLVEKAGYKMAFTTIYGMNQSAGSLFAEPRVRISGNDSLNAFIGKVNSYQIKREIK